MIHVISSFSYLIKKLPLKTNIDTNQNITVICITAYIAAIEDTYIMTITTTVKHRSSPESGEMIASFINNHPQGSLTTITRDGILQSSVVNVYEVVDGQYSFMTKKNTRKYNNIYANPIVSFITYDVFSQTEVEIEGLAMVINDQTEIDHILKKIRLESQGGRRYTSPYVDEFDDYVLYMIYPRKMHMTTYWKREKEVEAYHEYIEFDTKMRT